VKTRHLRLVTHTHSVTVKQTSSVSSPYGPVRAGLTTSPITSDQLLTVLLSSLEREVANLVSKSFTVLDTLERDTKAMRVSHSSTTGKAGTDE